MNNFIRTSTMKRKTKSDLLEVILQMGKQFDWGKTIEFKKKEKKRKKKKEKS